MKILDQEINFYEHPSGLKVYYFQNQTTAKFSANLAVCYGSNTYDEKIKPGSAHFLEHMMFHKEVGDYMREFDELAVDSNAYTTYSHTNYLISCELDFKAPLEKLFELVNTLYATEKNVDKERLIINEELNMYAQNPGEIIRNTHFQQMCNNSNFKYDIGGTIESISDLNVADLRYIHETYYKPSNQILTMAGPLDFDVIKAVVDSYYDEFTYSKPKPAMVVQDDAKARGILSLENKLFNTSIIKVSYKLTEDLDLDTYLALKSKLSLITSKANQQHIDVLNSNDINESFYAYVSAHEELDYVEFIMYGVDDLDAFLNYIQSVIDELTNQDLISIGIKKEVAKSIRSLDDVHKFASTFVHLYYGKYDVLKYYDTVLNHQLNPKKVAFEAPFITMIQKEKDE